MEEVATKAAQAATALAGIQQQSCNTGAESASAPPAPRPSSYAALPIQIEGTLHNPTSATSSHSASSVDGGFTPEIPASYVRLIQNGEFFDLAKLLPQNLQRLSTFENENVSLMVGPNSELKLAMTPSNSRLKQIDNIEDWTTAFTMFMKVFVKKFPNKASEFIEYLDIIRYAAKYHRSYGWLIYDYKFRHKAANDKSIAWGEVDQQLWVRVFTVNQAQLFEDCSISNLLPKNVIESGVFSYGPSSISNRAGAGRDGFCSSFNKGWTCPPGCKYIHACNKPGCRGNHAGIRCFYQPISSPQNQGALQPRNQNFRR